MTARQHALARQVRAAIFGGDAAAVAALSGLEDALSVYRETRALADGGRDGAIVPAEFEVSERLAGLVLSLDVWRRRRS
jgi:hypothetical protein